MKTFFMLISDAKDFMSNEINRLFVCVLVLNIVTMCFVHFEVENLKEFQLNENQKLVEALTHVRKRIDYRYFNTMRTFEDIYDVKIDTKDGEIKH